jgi:hypothetical protein
MKRLTQFVLAFFIVPAFAFAQQQQDLTSNPTLVGNTNGGAGGTLGSDIANLLAFGDNYVVPLIFGIAFIVFLWGVFQYFIAGGANAEKREEGQQFIMYAIIGFVLMLSVWGIVNLFNNSLNLGSNNRPQLPTFNSGSATNNQIGH